MSSYIWEEYDVSILNSPSFVMIAIFLYVAYNCIST
jgi:hypothetical protein